MPHPCTLAEVARRRNAGEDFSFLLREFLDEFYGALQQGGDAAACLVDDPPEVSDSREHASLGAIGEHLARRWNLPIPSWTEQPARFLRRPYFTTTIEGFKALLLAESPIAFRRRLIFTETEPLPRARMPKDPRTSSQSH
ncbi:MAG: hypothetical protein FJ147_01220 [Deltaproteobacteria bacterium]|nr:hypothetical protein [Deltaproteobacteria bacterium]